MTTPPVTTAFDVSLLGEFRLAARDAGYVSIPDQIARLIAFIALRGRRVSRALASAALWPEVHDATAQANLRTALHRWRQRFPHVAEWDDRELWLDTSVGIDLEAAQAVVARVRAGDAVAPAELQPLRRELLPGWYEDWIVFEREGFRQLCVHTLERASGLLLESGDVSGALEAGWLAIACDELRESAHRCLIRVHLAEGNGCEALRQRDRYVKLLRTEGMPVTLSPAMTRLFT